MSVDEEWSGEVKSFKKKNNSFYFSNAKSENSSVTHFRCDFPFLEQGKNNLTYLTSPLGQYLPRLDASKKNLIVWLRKRKILPWMTMLGNLGWSKLNSSFPFIALLIVVDIALVPTTLFLGFTTSRGEINEPRCSANIVVLINRLLDWTMFLLARWSSSHTPKITVYVFQ